MKRIISLPDPELFLWSIALIYLALINPAGQHFSFCIPHQLGFSFCPGCGIGHSISYLLHGEFQNAWQSHYLGIFALPVLFYRIVCLIPVQMDKIKKMYSGKINRRKKSSFLDFKNIIL